MSSESHCVGCGVELPPNRAPGRKRKWCTDRCRKQKSYDGKCIDCGTRTNGYDGPGTAPDRCSPCSNRHSAIWNRDSIIQAVQAWARENGVPPVATDWQPSHAINIGHPEKAEKFWAEDAWPHVTTVQHYFGSWAAAITAAGFQSFSPGRYGRDGDSPTICQEIRERYEAGEGSVTLGREYGCDPSSIVYRVRKAGGVIRPAGRPSREQVAA